MQEFTRLIAVCIIATICFIIMHIELIFIIPGILGMILMLYIVLMTGPKKFYKFVPPKEDLKTKIA